MIGSGDQSRVRLRSCSESFHRRIYRGENRQSIERREGGVRRRDEGVRGARVRDEEKKGEEDLLGLR